MENNHNDRIERYIYQVVRYLPRKNRADIEREIRSLIGDMLEERCGGREPQQKDIDIVLIELGDPRTLAGSYSEKGERYLIGPALYPRYTFVVKMVMIGIAGALTLAMTIQAFFRSDVTPVAHYAEWLATLLSVLAWLFTCITLIFALIENREHTRIGAAIGKGMDELEKDFRGEDGGTFLDRLPEVPKESARIPVGEPIAGIVFTVVFMVVLLVAPQFVSAYFQSDNGILRVPIFNADTVQPLMFPLAVCLVLGLVREIARLIEGRHTLRLGVITIACDLPALFLAIYVVTRKDLINPELYGYLAQKWPEAAEILPIVLQYAVPVFIVAFFLAFLTDMITAMVKGVKYN